MFEPPNIPLCRSEFLQDFTIFLGCHLSSANHGWRSFVAEVDACEHDGTLLERLAIWISTFYGTRVNLTIWEDQTIWISVALLPVEGEKFQLGFYPTLQSLTLERVVEALVETVSVSTRLCYDESPEPLMRKIWKYEGEVEIEGVL